MIEPRQLAGFIRSTLLELGLLTDKVNNNGLRMVLGTACKESECGRYLYQLGNGPARGVYQMEPDTADDVTTNFLNFHPDLKEKVFKYKLTNDWEELAWNLKLSTLMCRVDYYRFKEPLPNYLAGQAQYWKKYYNTEDGDGTITEYVNAWNTFIQPGVV